MSDNVMRKPEIPQQTQRCQTSEWYLERSDLTSARPMNFQSLPTPTVEASALAIGDVLAELGEKVAFKPSTNGSTTVKVLPPPISLFTSTVMQFYDFPSQCQAQSRAPIPTRRSGSQLLKFAEKPRQVLRLNPDAGVHHQ
jgi:hypothetical protein